MRIEDRITKLEKMVLEIRDAIEEWKKEFTEQEKKYTRLIILSQEFENYKRQTIKKKMEALEEDSAKGFE